MRTPLAVLLLALAPAFVHADLADSLGGCLGAPPERTIAADPSNYRNLLTTLGPGDRLLLAAGTYASGLPLANLHGAAGRCIAVEGPAAGARAVFTARDCCNTVSLTDVSYAAIRHLDLVGQGRIVDAVKAESPSVSVHHVTLEDLVITGHGGNQQVVGISTKCPAWNWVIRGNVIVGAGTGLYLGNSDGSAPFVNGLVEHNLVRDSLGYDMQVKHQLDRDTSIGLPGSGTTVIRHNVFSKAAGASTGVDARPAVLVGHWPLSGPGSTDTYQVYGNLFFENPVEALFQGEGNIAFHDNLLVRSTDPGLPAVAIQPHNDLPRAVDVFWNTLVTRGRGIRVSGGAAGTVQRVRANAVFSDLSIDALDEADDVQDDYAAASAALQAPFAPIGAGLDLYPRVGTLRGTAVATGAFQGYLDWNLDWNGTVRDATYRGAYSGEGANPGWALALAVKPASLPALSIANRTVTEGDSGTVAAGFAVTLSAPSSTSVTVRFATASGTATPGPDFVAVTGTVAFAPGQTRKTAQVRVKGDLRSEVRETYAVTLSAPAGATIADGEAVGAILDDDPLPSVSITAPAPVAEGNSGSVAVAFAVRLSAASGQTVTVRYATGGGTATAGVDYRTASGVLTFLPGQVTRNATVRVNGDTVDEPAETFGVTLSSPTAAVLDTASALATIQDDDP